MPKKKLKKPIETGFVPGIYNYCDRWCEKCEQQQRCMSFVMSKKMEEKGRVDFDEEELDGKGNVWSKLKHIFESTYEVLHELAEERGIEVEDIYTSENINREFWGEDFEHQLPSKQLNARIEMSDIIRMCLIYENLTEKYLDNILELFDKKKKGENKNLLEEAFLTIDWYQNLIQSKMRRALYAYFQRIHSNHPLEDYNGSAKVAFIALDRSVESWKIINEYFPTCKREISHLQVILQQLRMDMERQFPSARTFLRPGFETSPEAIN